MENDFVKETNMVDKTEIERDSELIKSLIKTKIDLQIATKNFEQAEEELIDYYVYQIKATQSKLDYLVKKAKKRRLALDIIEATKFKEDVC